MDFQVNVWGTQLTILSDNEPRESENNNDSSPKSTDMEAHTQGAHRITPLVFLL